MSSAPIRSYHAHVYYDPATTRGRAEALRQRIGERFAVQLGRWHDLPVGPHTAAMYQVAFAADLFASFVPWLMLNRAGLAVLVHPNTLAPRKKPFHTLNPAMAQLADGGTMVYGTMGGDGQPQTQATIFNRVMRFGDHPQQAIERPRWLLGRTWGQSSDSLKLESRFDPAVVAQLRALGHDVETIGAWDEGVGHAGMLVRHPNGVLEGGFDPRSNGAVAAF